MHETWLINILIIPTVPQKDKTFKNKIVLKFYKFEVQIAVKLFRETKNISRNI